MSALRPLTAFELFLQRRQQAAVEANGTSNTRSSENAAASAAGDVARGPAAPAPAAVVATSQPPPPPTLQPLALGTLRASHSRALPSRSNSAAERSSGRNPLRRSAPDLVPQVVASLPSPRLGGGSGGGAAAPAATDGAPSGPLPTAVYGELANAAASLANAAHKLARGSAADRSVAASYETLAQAAADLAASACMIRPLTDSASGSLPGRFPTNPPKLTDTRSGVLPRAVDPMAAAAAVAAADAAAAGGAGPSGGGSTAAATAAKAAHPNSQHSHLQQQQQQPPSRPGTGSVSSASQAGGRARVYAPRFPGYNPLIHIMESGLPPPGTAGAQRPTTSSPITHQLADDRGGLQPSAAGSASAASHISRNRRRRSSSLGVPPGRGGGGADAGELSRLPVLSLGPDAIYGSASQHGFGGTAGGRDVWFNDQLGDNGAGGLRGQRRYGDTASGVAEGHMADPHSLLAPYGDVRLSEWPPPDPIPTADVEQDEVDMRYNKVLAALRERVYARGPGRLAAAFRDADRDGCGLVSRRDFMQVLQAMNLGPRGLVDDKVVDLMLASVDAGRGGGGGGTGYSRAALSKVSYGDFVNALRFGTLPWRCYNRKLRHRWGGDPDQPIGPPHMAGSPPYGIAFGNDSSAGGAAAAASGGGAAAPPLPPPAPHVASAARLAELRLAFRQVDHNSDGVVEWAEFREALRRVGEQNRLQLSDQDLLQIYQDADPEFSTGVDYEAFMAAYGSGAGGGGGGGLGDTAAAQQVVVTSAHGGGGAAAAGMTRTCGPAPCSWSAQWRPADLPKPPPSLGPPPMTPMTPTPPAPLRTPSNHRLEELQYGGGASRLGLSQGAGAGTGCGGALRWGSGGGGGASGAGGARPEALRDMHAGAAAVLRRLGSAGGGSRAALRA